MAEGLLYESMLQYYHMTLLGTGWKQDAPSVYFLQPGPTTQSINLTQLVTTKHSSTLVFIAHLTFKPLKSQPG